MFHRKFVLGRVLALASLLILAPALAGCAKKTDSGTVTPTPTGATPTSGTPTPTGTPGGNVTAKPADVNASLTLALGQGFGSSTPLAGTPAAASGFVKFSVKDAGWKSFTVTASLKALQGDGVVLTIKDAKGAKVGAATLTCTDSPPVCQTPPKPTVITVTGSAVGEYTVEGSYSTAGASASIGLLATVKY